MSDNDIQIEQARRRTEGMLSSFEKLQWGCGLKGIHNFKGESQNT